ncbi:hypothetical protein [Sorangium sp. So ce513]|uniref:hypothetical protein n=1 Tax=Sorangium sp. So ce513 TaxID=3133315 RepID=UPI003F63E40A
MTRYAVLAVLAWGSACGGNVVIDGMPEGSGGAGATSTSSAGPTSAGVGVTSTSTGWATTSAVTSSSTGTGVGGGDARSTCARYCQLFEGRCGEVPTGCSRACDEWFGLAPACNELLVPYFECAIDQLDQCLFFPTDCERHLVDYSKCTSDPNCAPLACAGEGNRFCDCNSSCNGVGLSVECRPGGPGAVGCSCLIDGVEVFACEGRGPACTLAQDCCGSILDELR